MVLGVGVTLVVLIFPGPGIGYTQPASGSSTRPEASTRAVAKKLVQDGIAAQDAKDYSRAIALYLKAFSLDPHPLLLFNVAQAHRLAGCPQRAVPFYERYLALEPKGTQSAAARAALDEIRRASQSDGAACAKVSAADEPAGGTQSATATATGQLKLRSAPDGVMVMLDGVKIGVTPIERELAAGTHTIVLVDGGMLVGERKVEIDADKVVELTIPVEYQRDDARNRPPPSGPSRVLPVALFAGGGLALAVSGYMFYLGGQGGKAHPEDPFEYPYATGTGVALVGIGAAAIGVGAWLWVRGSRESVPIAAVGSGGVYFGWQGRF
jgi:hypothetical protein